MKLTESMLRRMIQEESRKLSRRKKVNESPYQNERSQSVAGALDDLMNSAENFLDSYMSEMGEDPERACQALMDEIAGFCEGFTTFERQGFPASA